VLRSPRRSIATDLPPPHGAGRALGLARLGGARGAERDGLGVRRGGGGGRQGAAGRQN
jgi:hypothetical protein